jgi:ring-1,2-phenylacetyl-CoA epoxidase subunit PaaD
VVTSTRSILETEAREAVAAVLDPELPMITIEDLGILRDVRLAVDDEQRDVVHVDITPTYAGCPAMDAIRADVEAALPGHRVVVHTVLAPAWSTDDLTAAGRAKLSAAGIAPPGVSARSTTGAVSLTLTVRCPQCGSPDTRELSRFGSTACKALWVCNACAEPFDRFKEL